MTTTGMATVVNGTLQLDTPMDLPEQSRVKVTVSPLTDDATQARRIKAFAEFRASVNEVNFKSDGERLTREQMHERR